MKNTLIVFLICILFFVLTGCKKDEVLSFSRTWEINIDGNDSDWPDTCIHYLEKPGQALCFANDNTYFYILLKISDPSVIRQFIGQGAIIWLQPTGKSRLGIHYPMSSTNNDFGDIPSENLMRRPGNSGDLPRGPYPNRGIFINPEVIELAKRKMEILVPSESRKQLVMSVVSKSYGIDAKFAYTGENFVYELKLPLQKLPQYDFSLNMENSKEINVIIISEAPDNKTVKPEGDLSDMGDNSGGMQPSTGSRGEFPGSRGIPVQGSGKTNGIELKFLVKINN